MERREQKNFLRRIEDKRKRKKKVDESNVAKMKMCLEKSHLKNFRK